MAKNLTEEREALYQMICSLKSEDIQKVFSYVSFLRFVDVYKDKAMADLLKIETAKSDLPQAALDDSPHDSVDVYTSDSTVTEDVAPPAVSSDVTEPDKGVYAPEQIAWEPVAQQTQQEQHEHEQETKQIQQAQQSIADEPLPLEPEEAAPPVEFAAEPDVPVAAPVAHADAEFFRDDDSFFAPVRSDYFDKKKGNWQEFDDATADESSPEPEPTEALSAEIVPKELPLKEAISPDDPDTDESDAQRELSRRVTIYEDPAQEPVKVEEELPPPDPHGPKLRSIAKALNLSFADVAFLFRASLPVVRTWFAGAEMGAEEEMQLQYILEVAELVEKLNIPRLSRDIRRPMPDGEFFLEKLKDRKVTGYSLKTLLETAKRSDELRRKFKGAKKPFNTMRNVIGLYAISLHCEG